MLANFVIILNSEMHAVFAYNDYRAVINKPRKNNNDKNRINHVFSANLSSF